MASASVYQWSAPMPADPGTQPTTLPARKAPDPEPRAFLWIPPSVVTVKAVIVGQHNMLEEDILDDAGFRQSMADLGVAIVWITPAADHRFDSDRSFPRFDKMLHDLAEVSGYSELAFAPVVPIGHSACASYPWNFAAAAPARTLAVLSIHGDAPMTPLAGFGPQSVHWPDHAIDGVPGVMAMGEWEWGYPRVATATYFRITHPKVPFAMLAEPAAGHFTAMPELIRFCTLFIRKALEQRLPPVDQPYSVAPPLRAIDPAKGWLVQRWTIGQPRSTPPGPVKTFAGDALDAFWAFDEESATTIQNYRADQINKEPQLIGFQQDGKLLPFKPTLEMVKLHFEPGDDGETISLQPTFLDHVAMSGEGEQSAAHNNLVRWSGIAAGAPIGHADAKDIVVHRIEGPIEAIGPTTFRLQWERGTSSFDRAVVFFAAEHPGDGRFKAATQQAMMPIPRNTAGQPQTITFEPIADTSDAATPMKLAAKSSAGLPVRFFIREGPAVVDGDTLKWESPPARAKYPMDVTVTAWQFGTPGAKGVQTAEPVTRTFHLLKMR